MTGRLYTRSMSEAASLLRVDQAVRLQELRNVIDGSLTDIARRFSRFLAGRWPHAALVIFTRECTGRPRKVAGAAEIIERITVPELEQLKSDVERGGHFAGRAVLGGRRRWTWAVRDDSDTLLVLVPRTSGEIPERSELAAVFGIVATSVRQQVIQASPEYLAESRAASNARAQVVDELTATHEAALERILVVLRSASVSDAQVRSMATSAVSDALIALRAQQATDRALAEESPRSAFERLQREIGALLRYQQVDADFVAPQTGARPIPGEVAAGARAMTQTVVLALITQPGLDRLRIAWGCVDRTLVIDIRDGAAGQLDSDVLQQNLAGRARTLQANLDIESVPGWGSRILVRIPLDPPAAMSDQPELGRLNRREREVLALLAMGKRNKAIAAQLGVAESTAKFHVAGLLKKLEVSSRMEAAAIGVRAGLVSATPVSEHSRG